MSHEWNRSSTSSSFKWSCSFSKHFLSSSLSMVPLESSSIWGERERVNLQHNFLQKLKKKKKKPFFNSPYCSNAPLRFFNPSLNWGNLIIMLLIDLKFACPEAVLLTSIIFLSSFSSNLLYFSSKPQPQSMHPTLLDNDFREGPGWHVPSDKTEISYGLEKNMNMLTKLNILHIRITTNTLYVMSLV